MYVRNSMHDVAGRWCGLYRAGYSLHAHYPLIAEVSQSHMQHLLFSSLRAFNATSKDVMHMNPKPLAWPFNITCRRGDTL